MKIESVILIRKYISEEKERLERMQIELPKRFAEKGKWDCHDPVKVYITDPLAAQKKKIESLNKKLKKAMYV